MAPTTQDTAREPGPPRVGGRPDLSVVVPTARRSTRLALTLAALRLQTLPPDRFEVVVVDDAPHEGWVDEAMAHVPPVAFPLRVVAGTGHGPGAARNLGAREARAGLLLFLDDDTPATPGVLAAHLAAHLAGHADADEPGAGPARVVHGAISDLTAFAVTADDRPAAEVLTGVRGRTLGVPDLPRRARALAPRRSLIENVARAVTADPAYRSLAWLACVGTNTSVRREPFERVGGFDAEYGRRWGGEDLELGLRLAGGGARFVLADAPAYHLFRSRPGVETTLPEFWALVAGRHGVPELAEVGELLLGRIDLDDLARRLGGAGDLVPAGARQRSDHGGRRPADPA